MSALETEPLTIQAVIFDLDGVLLSTDEYHYSAWMQMAAEMLQVIPEACWVIEDADSGVLSAKAAGMLTLGFGAAENNSACDSRAASMAGIDRKLFASRGILYVVHLLIKTGATPVSGVL